MSTDDARVDPAGDIAQCMAETLGEEPEIDIAIVIIVKVRDEAGPLYRVGAFAPNQESVREHLRAVLKGLDEPGAVYVDRRNYKPEVDGQ